MCFASADWIAMNLGIDAGYTGILFGFLAFNNYMRYRQEHDSSTPGRASSFAPAPTISTELQAQLIQLKKALDDEDFENLEKLAEAIASSDAPAAARIEALEATAWGQLLQENVTAARGQR